MTSTSTFLGVSDGSKLSSRVLKPPGGGSSISFEDDTPFYRRFSSASSSPPSTPNANSGSSTPPKCSSNGSVGGNTPPRASPEPTKAPVINTVGENKEVVVTSPAPETTKPISAVVEAKATPSVESSTTEVSTKEQITVHKTSEQVSMQTKLQEAVTEKLQNITVKEQGTFAASPKDSPIVNGHSYVRSGSTSTSGSISPVPSNGSTPESRTRVVRDHMKSRIFTDDVDWSPSRTSRMNNATINDRSFQAEQRQRVPPGGYSTKLW